MGSLALPSIAGVSVGAVLMAGPLMGPPERRVPCPILGHVPWSGIWLGDAGGGLGLCLTRIPV